MMAASVWASVATPKSATNGSSTTAGSGGNGMRARPVGRPEASVTGRTSRKKSLYGASLSATQRHVSPGNVGVPSDEQTG